MVISLGNEQKRLGKEHNSTRIIGNLGLDYEVNWAFFFKD